MIVFAVYLTSASGDSLTRTIYNVHGKKLSRPAAGCLGQVDRVPRPWCVEVFSYYGARCCQALKPHKWTCQYSVETGLSFQPCQ